jgi:hypothetical protein
MTISPGYVEIGAGLLMVAISVPLVARMVPMNRFYGIRTRKAFASESNWYELNAYGGWLFIAFGALLAAAGAVNVAVAPDPTSIWAPVLIVVPMLGVVPVLLLINARGKQLPG